MCCEAMLASCLACADGVSEDDYCEAHPAQFGCPAAAPPALAGPPRDCVSWNDGCNTCTVRGGRIGACSMMMCFREGSPFCAAYSDGRTCTAATSCTRATGPATAAVDPGFAVDEGVDMVVVGHRRMLKEYML
jgi:hypothetical protein